MVRKRIRVVERKLGREGAVGLSYGDGVIEVDPRQCPFDYLDTLIHECLHEVFPDKPEEDVYPAATAIAKVLWKQGFRRVDQ